MSKKLVFALALLGTLPGCYVTHIITTIQREDDFLKFRRCELYVGMGNVPYIGRCKWDLISLKPEKD